MVKSIELKKFFEGQFIINLSMRFQVSSFKFKNNAKQRMHRSRVKLNTSQCDCFQMVHHCGEVLFLLSVLALNHVNIYNQRKIHFVFVCFACLLVHVNKMNSGKATTRTKQRYVKEKNCSLCSGCLYYPT